MTQNFAATLLAYETGQLYEMLANKDDYLPEAIEAARAEQEKIVQAQLDYGPTLCVLAMIDAALGHKDLALEEGRRAIALVP